MIGKTIAHYTIKEKLGEGGMGIVYLAEDLRLERPVAIKFLQASALGSNEEKLRFLQEARISARLDHPNICTIYEIGESDDQIYIAMAYIDGQTLRQRLATGPLGIRESLEVGIQLARGLHEAHEADIVHRDVKSANIMVTHRGGQVKIMDFGVAKIVGGFQLTKVGSTVGTAAYMSPEQARGVEVDYRTDIWSTGVVLYEIFTTQYPFRGNSEFEMTSAILKDNPASPSDSHPQIPEEVRKVIYRCLEKDVEKRYQSLEEVASELEGIVKSIELKEAASHLDQPTAINASTPSEEAPPQAAAAAAPPKGFPLKGLLFGLGGVVVLAAGAWLLWDWNRGGSPNQAAPQPEQVTAIKSGESDAMVARTQMLVAQQRADSLNAATQASAIYNAALDSRRLGQRQLDQENFARAKNLLDLARDQFELARQGALEAQKKVAASKPTPPAQPPKVVVKKPTGPSKAELAAQKAAAERQAKAEEEQRLAQEAAEEARQQRNAAQRSAALDLQEKARQEKAALETSHQLLAAYKVGEAAERRGESLLSSGSFSEAGTAYSEAAIAFEQAASDRRDQIKSIHALLERYRREYAAKNLEQLKLLQLAMDPAEEKRLGTFFEHARDLTVDMSIRDDLITFVPEGAWAVVDVQVDFSRSRGGGAYNWRVEFIERERDWLIGKIVQNR